MRFKRVYIEITNICNLNCSFCPPSTKKSNMMTKDEFSQILDQLSDYTEYLYFHIKGEPLLHPEIGCFLDMCYEKRYKVNITTNGTLINPVKEMLLTKPAIRQISISLQSIENIKELQSKESYIHDIIDFSKEAIEKTNVFIELRLWNLEKNNVKQSNNRYNSIILKIIEEELGLKQPIIEQVNEDKGTKLIEHIYLSQNREFEWPDINKDIVDRNGFCYGLKQQIGILVDGTVVPCCLDSEGVVNLGNVFADSLSKILDKSRTKRIIEGFSNHQIKEPLCQRCGYRRRFT